MKVLQVKQGSDQWLQARETHFCASDAAAMMGVSPYKSREDLLKEKSTGIKEAIDAGKQALFDRGHAAEDAARKIITEQIGEDLFPMVCEKGDLLASLDGVTMDEKTLFEHKLFNKKLAPLVEKGELPETHYWQLEHQLYVSGAQQVIFVVSDGTEEKMVQMIYEAVPGRLEELQAGWAQFIVDLNGFKPVTETIAPAGKAVMELPALLIEMEGSIKTSNLVEYENTALAFIQSISTDLNTDQDFADAENLIKFCDRAEKELELAKKQALSQTQSIDDLFRAVDRIKEELRSKRLDLNKLTKTRKEEVRAEIVNQANSDINEHIKSMSGEYFAYVKIDVNPDFTGAIKGKRTVKSLHEACNDELARCKIESNRIMEGVKVNQQSFNALSDQHKLLFADIADLIFSSAEHFTTVMNKRIKEHDAEEKRKRAEANAERITTIRARITKIRNAALVAISADLTRTKRMLDDLEHIDFEVGFDELQEEAMNATIETIDQVKVLIDQKQAAEDQRLKEEQEEQDRINAEETKPDEVEPLEIPVTTTPVPDNAAARDTTARNTDRGTFKAFADKIWLLMDECPESTSQEYVVLREAILTALQKAAELAKQ